MSLQVAIPVNTTATVYVPARYSAGVTEGDQAAGQVEGVRFIRMEGGAAVFEVGSGRYYFQAKMVASPSQSGRS